MAEAPLAPNYECEGRISDQHSSLAVVVTHPWGPLGGNYHNNVVAAVAAFFSQQLSITTVRFNFTGSQIGFGTAQVRQVVHICQQLLLDHPNIRKILLVGYSYGSLITTSASADAALPPELILGTISIAPPFGVQHWLLLFQSSYHTRRAAAAVHQPRLFLIGNQDNFTTVETFQQTIQRDYGGGTEEGSLVSTVIVDGVDHFWRRREKDIVRVIRQWLLEQHDGLDSLSGLARYYNADEKN